MRVKVDADEGIAPFAGWLRRSADPVDPHPARGAPRGSIPRVAPQDASLSLAPSPPGEGLAWITDMTNCARDVAILFSVYSQLGNPK